MKTQHPSKIQLKVDETKLVQNLRHAFTQRSNVISELMQNARRAGATKIRFQLSSHLSNSKLTIEDNGNGIDDFADLLTVASSGWDAETIETESPFGLGFLSALYACKSIMVESNGKSFLASTQDIMEQKRITIDGSHLKSGTRLSLYGMDYPEDDLRVDIQKLARGFPVPIFLDEIEMPRSDAIDQLKGIETDIGFFHLKAVHDDHVAIQNTQVYLQGLPIRYNAENSRMRRGDNFEISTGKCYSSHANIVHLDSSQFIARVPDRDVLIDCKLVEDQIIKTAKTIFMDHLKHQKATLSAEAFVTQWWAFAHVNIRISQGNDYKAFFNDIEFVPGKVFQTVTDYPYVLRPDEDCDYMKPCETDLISKKSLQDHHQIFKLDQLYDTNYDESNAIAYMFARYTPSVLVLDQYTDNFHKGHWIHDCLEDINNPAEQFSYTLNNLDKTASFDTGAWTDSIEVLFCDSCEIRHVKSGKTVLIDKDAFVLPAYKGVIYPEAEQSGMVVTQLTRFVDEWDSWREDEQEDEENLFIRFVLSERTDNPEVLLQQLLNSVQAGKYTTLLGKRFTVDVSEDGKLDVSV